MYKRQVLELDSRFHTQIANAAQNPMLATITEYITRLTMPSRLETTRKMCIRDRSTTTTCSRFRST